MRISTPSKRLSWRFRHEAPLLVGTPQATQQGAATLGYCLVLCPLWRGVPGEDCAVSALTPEEERAVFDHQGDLVAALVRRLAARCEALEGAATRASAELRHAWKGQRKVIGLPDNMKAMDIHLVDRAIVLLECAALSTTEPAKEAPVHDLTGTCKCGRTEVRQDRAIGFSAWCATCQDHSLHFGANLPTGKETPETGADGFACGIILEDTIDNARWCKKPTPCPDHPRATPAREEDR